jgi:hypothetical protein
MTPLACTWFALGLDDIMTSTWLRESLARCFAAAGCARAGGDCVRLT